MSDVLAGFRWSMRLWLAVFTLRWTRIKAAWLADPTEV